jgi:hypothetical protein
MSLNRRMSKRKGSKVTLKKHRKHLGESVQADLQGGPSALPAIRPEDINMHT